MKEEKGKCLKLRDKNIVEIREDKGREKKKKQENGSTDKETSLTNPELHYGKHGKKDEKQKWKETEKERERDEWTLMEREGRKRWEG